MKKSKLILVSMLALVLCFMCLTSMTFSWFNRPQSNKGDSLGWNIDYETSVGSGISMVTYESLDGGVSYNEEAPVTEFSNTEGIAPGERKWYRTDIINNGDSAQTVSLYLSRLSLSPDAQGSFYLGVNAPLKTYKNYFSYGFGQNKTVSQINRQNVYLGLHKDKVAKLSPTVHFIHAWNDGGVVSDCNWSSAVDTGGTGTWSLGTDFWNNSGQTFNIYAMEIDYRCTRFQFVKKDNNYYSTPQPLISQNNTMVYFEYDNKYIVQEKTSGTAAGIETFYSNAAVRVGDTVDLAATGKANITYKSSAPDIASVDASGTVTGNKTGTATITVTSTGVYGDKISAECVVTVSDKEPTSIKDVPIITNLKVAGLNADGEQTVESVYWYIKNDSESGTLVYNVEDIYLTL